MATILTKEQEKALAELNQLVIMSKFQLESVRQYILTSEESSYFCDKVAEILATQEKLIANFKEAEETGKSGNVLAHLFSCGYDCYVTELDIENKIILGYARIQGLSDEFEFGRTCLKEIFSVGIPLWCLPEVDFYFNEQPWEKLEATLN